MVVGMPKYDSKLRQKVYSRDEGFCRKCGRPGNDIHHIIYKSCGGNNTESIGVDFVGNKEERFEKFPTSIIKFNREMNGMHPTQKPVALFEYLIKTYTNEGDLVLDNCAGSGTTGVACKNLNRNFILIEKEPKYVEIIKQRLNDALSKQQEGGKQ